MLEIVQIPVLRDNYVYLLHEPVSGATAAVDPAVAEPVLTSLRAHGWTLTHILNTHHHADHVGGNLRLKQETGCRVFAGRRDRERIPGIDVGLDEGDRVELGKVWAQVLAVPGHTHGHIAYHFVEDGALFCGDTLFALGCGRVFEGTAAELWDSLDRLRVLPKNTRVYCAHEYTQNNGRFALLQEPGNVRLRARLAEVDRARAEGHPTVPSLLSEELETNPFLRPESTEIRARLALEDAPAEQVFAELRRLKDSF